MMPLLSLSKISAMFKSKMVGKPEDRLSRYKDHLMSHSTTNCASNENGYLSNLNRALCIIVSRDPRPSFGSRG